VRRNPRWPGQGGLRGCYADEIHHRTPLDAGGDAGSPSAVIAFTASMLTGERSARPATAHAFAAALTGALDGA
jgi:hypothetical protein